MTVLRYILAALMAFYFAANAVLAKALIDFKLNGVRPDAASHRWAPVLTDMAIWQSAIWLAGVALYGVAAVMLALKRGGARYAYAVGVACDFMNWQLMMTHPSYTGMFGPGQAWRDTAIFGVLALVGVFVWRIDRAAQRQP